MFIHCDLLILMLVLTLDGRVHTGEIIGGHEAVPHSRPYMVLVEGYHEDGSTIYCGGFLLNEEFVVTAAHCRARFYNILLGLHDHRKKEGIQRLCVKQEYQHEDFNTNDFNNDIMLLKLSSKAHFNNNVKPIALAGKDDVNLPKACFTSGWGATGKINTYMSPVLREINVTLVDNEGCARANLYCAEGEDGPSIGDSGGPLVCEDETAYGVVCAAFGHGSNENKSYTKIPEFRDWIDSIMNKL
uniref:trypsin n=1 Tax=Anoplopoma fimbria TaxID=229290 RepID=C3KJU6_ANOFI|nr:Natural killer cell protease 1 precursor [Anoplopoma fimbria]